VPHDAPEAYRALLVDPQKRAQAIVEALAAGRKITTLPDGTIEIGPEEPDDPDEVARVAAFLHRIEPEEDRF